jgi:hypothetical protein
MFDFASGILLDCFIGATHAGAAQAPPTLHTLQVTVSLQADETSPRVRSIETPAGTRWINSRAESHIEWVQVKGRPAHLHSPTNLNQSPT